MENRTKIHDLDSHLHTVALTSHITTRSHLDGDDGHKSAIEDREIDPTADLAFARVNAKLKAQIGADAYASWFGRLKLVELTPHQVCLSVPTAFLRSWINNHYFPLLAALWREENPEILRVEIVVRSARRHDATQHDSVSLVSVPDIIPVRDRPDKSGEKYPFPLASRMKLSTLAAKPVREKKLNQDGKQGQGLNNGEENSFSTALISFGSPLDGRYNFDNFVEGASNRVALAAARSIAEAGVGALRFNPLFIHAGVGLGKTHLLQAIARASLARLTPDRIVYLTAEYFMWRFASAIRDNDTLAFKEQLRAIDLLIIDDMQFLQGKSIQNEFCHLLNSLLDSARQIVVAADRPALELESLDPRVRSRLSGGVSLEMGLPDYTMRFEILRRRLQQAKREDQSLHISDEILQHIAQAVSGSGRDLEGAFNQILFRQSFEPNLSISRIDEILGHLTRSSGTRRVRIEDIQRFVARHYNISKQDMLSSRRTRTVVRPRQVAMYLAKMLTPRSLPEIGRNFGGRDHTTVLHAVRTVENRLGTDQKLAQEVELLKRLINERPS